MITYSCNGCGVAFQSDAPHVVWTGDERRWIAVYYCSSCLTSQDNEVL